jgi:hypothetical protein
VRDHFDFERLGEFKNFSMKARALGVEVSTLMTRAGISGPCTNTSVTVTRSIPTELANCTASGIHSAGTDALISCIVVNS